MIKEAIGTGTTVSEAFEDAKAKLNAPDDVTVEHEIIDEGKKKTLGLFGGSPAKVRAFYNVSEYSQAEEYITAILKGMGVEDPKMEIEEEDGTVKIQLDCGNDQGTVIGRRGETLDAIQYLTRLIINKNSEDYKRVSINIGNYREKREETLKEVARKNAAKVKKYGRSIALNPMNPYERRVIHTEIQEIEGVTSHSIGSDSDRRVVITLAEGFKATEPGGGYNRGGYYRGRDDRGRGGKGNYRRGGKSNQQSSQDKTPSRPPRSDSTTASLYGKIEPKS
ncbi:MAG: protein jag [Clostridiales bacterium]|nr:protein jag [Clostridiales bacterium]